jgi:hypothetical protein
VPFFAYPGLMGATGRGESPYKNYTNDLRLLYIQDFEHFHKFAKLILHRLDSQNLQDIQ